ncbi:MAG: recombinase RecA, partial [Clostridia bacterium]|nr:recombinase RecA [Deltaproteobacteria bacterium]
AVARGHVEILWQPPTEAILDAVGARLISMVRRMGAKRVFIDSFGAFQAISFHQERVVPFFAAIANELRASGTSSVWSYETPHLVGSEIPAPLQGISPMVDNALVMRFVEVSSQLHRMLSIMKKRNGGFDPTLCNYAIGATGITLGAPFVNAEALLTGTPHRAKRSKAIAIAKKPSTAANSAARKRR